MDLFLQFGYGMKALTIDLSKKWNGVSVILSPRDMTPAQLVSWSNEFQKAKVKCYFDPQCYCPKSEQKRLSQYEYWDKNLNTNIQSNDTIVERKIKFIKKYNEIAQTEAYILPGILHNYDVNWEKRFVFQVRAFINAAHNVMKDKPIFATLALPKDFLIQNGAQLIVGSVEELTKAILQ